VSERNTDRMVRLGDHGMEETTVPIGALIVGIGCLSDPRAPGLSPPIDSVDLTRMVYTVKGDRAERSIPANHVRASALTWRPMGESP